MAQDIGAKNKKYMKNTKRNKIIEGTYGKMKPVKDFLPRPEELIMKEPGVKITITLRKENVDFFKKEAQRLNTSYQRMIRNLLQQYTKRMKRD